jgi:hypothetical protein
MFYRLTHVDGVPLPATVRFDGRAYVVMEGGLLTEPPAPDQEMEGYAVFRLGGPPDPDGLPSLVLQSSEPYRWLASGQLEIARAGGAPCLRLRGRVAGSMLTLEAEPAPELLGGAQFSLVEAGEEQIPPWWQGTFDFGPPARRWVPAPPTDPEVLRAVAAEDVEQERLRMASAERRLLRAWRAGT